MREILFRGKRIDNGEWAYGFFALSPRGIYYITETVCGHASPRIVDRATVGQYTGLTDKNGKRIFEGDIVDMDGNWWDVAGPAGHESPIAKVCWCDGLCGFEPFADYDCDCGVYIEAHKCKVIGNIHDNPELIGGVSDENA